ncbi:MAG TPA: hypothetical protein VL727_20155 [Puia sp.]|jgi:hypothetical protein|nr:hypothetical protein [Puia sp.]
MRTLYFICLILLLITGSGCTLLNDPLPHLWFYTYSQGGETDSLLNPASFLELRKDGTYTRDFGRFDYGTWVYKDKVLHLNDRAGGITNINVFPVTSVSSKELQLDLGGSKTGFFESQPLEAATSAEDPFSGQNNQWRLPAVHKENEEQIKKRLYNHCQFWETYFTWALKNELSTIDVRSTPTAIKIYGNGFGLKPFEELPPRWKACFFDADDCLKANDMIQDIFQHRNIAWAHTDNKYKLFISAFQQLKRYLR